MIRNRPSPEGEALGRELARMTEESRAKALAVEPRLPDPCASCAFRLGTVPNRCLTTVRDAMKCVMEANQFDCHAEVDAAGLPVAPCSGYLICLLAMADEPPEIVPWDYSDGMTTWEVRAMDREIGE